MTLEVERRAGSIFHQLVKAKHQLTAGFILLFMGAVGVQLEFKIVITIELQKLTKSSWYIQTQGAGTNMVILIPLVSKQRMVLSKQL